MKERVWLRQWLERSYELAFANRAQLPEKLPDLIYQALTELDFGEVKPVETPTRRESA